MNIATLKCLFLIAIVSGLILQSSLSRGDQETLEYKECFNSVVPTFHKSVTSEEISYISYSAIKGYPSSKPALMATICDDPNVPIKLYYSIQDARKTFRPVDINKQSVLFSTAGSGVDKDGAYIPTGSMKSKLPFYKTLSHLRIGIKPASSKILSKPPVNQINPSSLSVESEALFTRQSFLAASGRQASVPWAKTEIDINVRFASHVVATPKISSNSCWLMIPQAVLDWNISKNKYVDLNGRSGVKFHRYQDLKIFKARNTDGDGVCQQPTIEYNATSELASIFGYVPVGAPFVLVSDLLEDLVWKRTVNGTPTRRKTQRDLVNQLTSQDVIEPIKKAKIEQPYPFGMDYDAFSFGGNSLDLVVQQGFHSYETSSDSNNDEKYLYGELKYLHLDDTNTAGSPVGSRLKATAATDINTECKLDGWSFSPKFSETGNYLYFLHQHRDPSKKTIFDAGPTSLIRIDLESTNQHSNLKHRVPVCKTKTEIIEPDRDNTYSSLFDRHIQGFEIFADNTELSVIFEVKGESQVHFFRLNRTSGRIIFKHPYVVRNLGRIYDITVDSSRSESDDARTFYIFHSDLTYPTRVSQCTLSGQRLNCEFRSGQARYSGDHKVLKSNSVRKKKFKFSITKFANCTGEDLRSKTIDVFKLIPKGKSKGIIVSIHGGPNDAWNGTFHKREYRLAELGYTVFLPNPTGSTGYGFEFVKSAKCWGTTILEDVKQIIRIINSSHRAESDKLFVMGYSFGGYINNMLQVIRDEKETAGDADKYFSTQNSINGFISINPVFDIKRFADSTDQLWFPEFQLGFSGHEMNQLSDSAYCNNVLWDPKYLPYQNPAALFCKATETNKEVNPNPKPNMIIAGTYDQRVHFCSNVPEMLEAFRKHKIPYTLHLEKQSFHEFDFNTLNIQAERIHGWISELGNCIKNGNTTMCKLSDADLNARVQNKFGRVFDQSRPGDILFDNNLHYGSYHTCLRDISVVTDSGS